MDAEDDFRQAFSGRSGVCSSFQQQPEVGSTRASRKAAGCDALHQEEG